MSGDAGRFDAVSAHSMSPLGAFSLQATWQTRYEDGNCHLAGDITEDLALAKDAGAYSAVDTESGGMPITVYVDCTVDHCTVVLTEEDATTSRIFNLEIDETGAVAGSGSYTTSSCSQIFTIKGQQGQ
jgi:hypothetical protein